MKKRRGPIRRLWDNLVVRTIGYYVLLFSAAFGFWRIAPDTVLFLTSGETGVAGLREQGRAALAEILTSGAGSMGRASDMVNAGVAMAVAGLLSLPVGWLYILTRRKKGFRQSVVHTLIMLPLVVAGVVVLVKNSLALAFALAGIVAAVRFRNTLEDSKDAVYIFLSVAIGLSAGVDLAVAVTLSVFFNLAILALWYSDFGRTSAVFEGAVAEQRLAEARQFAGRQSSFVTKLDDEILKSLSAEQLEVVAEKAWKRRNQAAPELESEDEEEPTFDVLLRVRTRDPDRARLAAEPVLSDQLKKWRFSGIASEGAGVHVLEYAVRLRRKMSPNSLRDALERVGSPDIMGVEVQ
ncbi:MAG: DUF4956 domain-containing protein [Gemmatimonadetes bacterium]|nr:DUF4956 domain-containing protein [Gemmatimonadota bacterium]